MRLIDADALLGILGEMPLIWEYGQVVSDIYDIAEKQPTAYDVDKVVERLEKRISQTMKKSILAMVSKWCFYMTQSKS